MLLAKEGTTINPLLLSKERILYVDPFTAEALPLMLKGT